MTDLYYTEAEISKLQINIINKYFSKNQYINNVKTSEDDIKSVCILNLLKEFEIIGYEESYKYKVFLNISGNIFSGIEENELYNGNLVLNAFYNSNNAGYLVKKTYNKTIILPKIVLSHIIDNELIIDNYKCGYNIANNFGSLSAHIIKLNEKILDLETKLDDQISQTGYLFKLLQTLK